MMTCEEVRLALGAHALGALDPEEALEVDQHLATCDECGAELLDLEGVASFLGKVSERDVQLVASPPRRVLDRLLNDRARRTRRGRLLLVAAASVAALAIGGSVLTAVTGGVRQEQSAAAPAMATPSPRTMADAPQEGQQRALSKEAEPSASAFSTMAPRKEPSKAVQGREFAGRNAGRSATISAYPGDGGGTELTVRVGGVPVGTTCRLRVLAADGRRDLTESWVIDSGTYRDNTVFKRETSLPMSAIARFDVVDQAGRVLVRVPVGK
ncbi:hypothetical protein FH608_042400 [Nonomuraea phyllanthi]|uniref:Putative zinc-finger domain-containing protein n=1 Tax=Nonomuraea phyllanthi TaxID=2219224 RepID=A0A5C4VG18_9ACTN|nr:zf-HC2 domain-containing protein [Nonomuraea phyllanthi]KAB8188739.1 hypothetical protein FH608_042400 [Nonomuraea phyllanthi]